MIKINKVTEMLEYLDGLQAVVFDLDDTLYSEKEYVKSGYHVLGNLLQNKIINAESLLWESFNNGENAIDVVLQNAGVYSDELKEKCIHAYRFQENPKINLYDGVDEMLTYLRNAGYKLGMITDGRPEGQRAKIKALGLYDRFDQIIITDELGGPQYRKPNHTAFIKMQHAFNIPFSAIAYVGDNISKDFLSPEKLGMKSIYFENIDGLYVVI